MQIFTLTLNSKRLLIQQITLFKRKNRHFKIEDQYINNELTPNKYSSILHLKLLTKTIKKLSNFSNRQFILISRSKIKMENIINRKRQLKLKNSFLFISLIRFLVYANNNKQKLINNNRKLPNVFNVKVKNKKIFNFSI